MINTPYYTPEEQAAQLQRLREENEQMKLRMAQLIDLLKQMIAILQKTL